MSDAPPPAESRSATLREVTAMVFSSFLGVRKRAAMRKDAVTVRPHQVVIVGIIAAAIFVAILLVVVRVIIRAAGA